MGKCYRCNLHFTSERTTVLHTELTCHKVMNDYVESKTLLKLIPDYLSKKLDEYKLSAFLRENKISNLRYFDYLFIIQKVN